MIRAFVVLAVVSAASASGQATIFRVDFELSNPGARSLGFGGAFAALADDATAAYANPAGLVQLSRPEVSLELRSLDRSVRFLAGGRVDGEPTGIGLDVEPGPINGRAGEDATGVSFASAVVPWRRWSFALYRHQLARFAVETESRGHFFDLAPGIPGRAAAGRGRLDLDLDATGLAAAWRMNDATSLGFALVEVRGGVELDAELFFPQIDSFEDLFAEIPRVPETRIFDSSARVDDSAVALHVGALWQPSERLSTGVFYRHGPELDGRQEQRTSFPGEPVEVEVSAAVLDVPDVFGAGVAYRALGGRLTLAMEADLVTYGAIVRAAAGDPADSAPDDEATTGEVHVGAEYAFLTSRPLVALRAGAWYDSRPDDLIAERGGSIHWALGVGIAGDHVQLDLGADFADAANVVGISAIYSF